MASAAAMTDTMPTEPSTTVSGGCDAEAAQKVVVVEKEKSLAAAAEAAINRHCAYCLKQFKRKSECGGCRRRAYCSKDCQKKDWSPKGDGQGHKIWCSLGCGEEDIDWKVAPIVGKGMGVIALRDIPPKFRIMVDRGLTKEEAKSRPQVMDLYPDGETFEKKFEINGLASDVGSIVCPRLSRVNHACVSNAAHWYDNKYRVKILFSEKEIKAGEEITFSYISHRSVHYNYTKNTVSTKLKFAWGIECPDDCACKKDEVWAMVHEIRALDQKLETNFRFHDLVKVYTIAKRILKLQDKLQVGLLAKKTFYPEVYQILIMRPEGVGDGLAYLREAREIEKCVEPFKRFSQIEALLDEPWNHENYHCLKNVPAERFSSTINNEKIQSLLGTGNARPFMGGPYQGGPFMGGPFMGGPFMGGPFMGGPYLGGPYEGGPDEPDLDRLKLSDPNAAAPYMANLLVTKMGEHLEKQIREEYRLKAAAAAGNATKNASKGEYDELDEFKDVRFDMYD